MISRWLRPRPAERSSARSAARRVRWSPRPADRVPCAVASGFAASAMTPRRARFARRPFPNH